MVIFGCTFGLFFIYKSKKLNAKLLFYAGLCTIFASLLFLGQFIDFLTILFTGRNLEPYQLYAILCYMWVAPALICGMYIGAELMIPEKKKLILGIYLVFGIIFELFLLFDTNNSYIFILPANLGENIIDVRFNRRHPTFFLIAFFLLSVLIFNGFGFLFKSFKSTGILRKKFLYLSLGWIVFVIAGVFDAFTAPGFGLFLVRIVMNSSSIFWYLGLKEERVKTRRQPSEEKVILEESKTSLIETLSLSKPSEITKEEVSLYREQNLCLVCKTNVLGFSFICECNTLYCQKCAQALVQLDNACWVCNAPIDKSKPPKPFKKEKEQVEVEISEKPKKTSKKLK